MYETSALKKLLFQHSKNGFLRYLKKLLFRRLVINKHISRNGLTFLNRFAYLIASLFRIDTPTFVMRINVEGSPACGWTVM